MYSAIRMHQQRKKEDLHLEKWEIQLNVKRKIQKLT